MKANGTALARWLDRNGTTSAEFGARIGTTDVTVRRYRSGARMPEPAVMVAIQKATRGEVTADHFHIGLRGNAVHHAAKATR